MEDVLRAIAARDRVFLRREALSLGYDDKQIARHTKAKVWIRIRHGAYVFADVWDSLSAAERFQAFNRAVYKQAKTEVVLSHVSALPELGSPIWGHDLTTGHVTRRDGRAGRHEAGVQQHTGRIGQDDVTLIDGVRVMCATRVALEVTTVSETEAALCVIDDLLHRGLTDESLLADRYKLMEYWPSSLRTDLVLRLSDGRSESVGETRTRYLCWRGGLPAPTPQYPITDASGRVIARVDLAWPELGVFAEFDGKVKYQGLLRAGESASDAVVREKRRQDLICELTGWRCIRLTWWDLEHPDRTIARLRTALFPSASGARTA